jgi:formamidopyrimidine-DNA glycosylase
MLGAAMPELPEVERSRRIASAIAVGRRIVAARCADDPIVFDGVSPARVRQALIGRRVNAIRRHGKHLWLELDRRPWPCLHFGMTGGFHTARGGPRVTLKSSYRAPDESWPPRFTKLHLVFDDGGELVLADARRLGRVRLRQDPSTEPPISLLGFDAHRALPPLTVFRRLVRERSAPLKALLLDQTFAAGVGNWIADEVLYQARLDPRRSARSLSDAEVARMRSALKKVIDTSVRLSNDSDRYPRGWLFHRRWGKNPRAVTRTGLPIRHITLGGRTTAWVPGHQR